MAKKIGFLVNSDRCIGCHACELACKNEYQQEPEIRWRKVYPLKEDSFGVFAREFASLACNHCEDPACLKLVRWLRILSEKMESLCIARNAASVAEAVCWPVRTKFPSLTKKRKK